MRSLFLLPALVTSLMAQPAAPVTREQRLAVVKSLGEALRTQYVFPEVADTVAKALSAKVAKGDYDASTTAEAFAKALHEDLRALGKDGHFRVMHAPDFKPRPESQTAPTAEQMAQAKASVARRGFGLARTEILQGNVGYLDVRGFPSAETVGAAYSAALTLLSGTDALVLDLRQNGGGSPEGVVQLVSHFFPEGDSRHINSIYSRKENETRQFWTSATASPRYTKPVYVLTSGFTFSGGEECAYDFQTQKRATLVGEVTGGGANPGDVLPLVHGFVAFIPNGRAINPVTKTNWEHVGVKPDVEAPAAEALKVAHLAALKQLLEKESDADRKQRLQKTLQMVEKGELPPPRFTKPQ